MFKEIDRKAFNIMKEHLLKQMAKSMSDGQCRYRGSGGSECAVGCLISDNIYYSGLEGCNADNPVVLAAIEESGNGTPNIRMLNWMQNIHDQVSLCDWEQEINDYESALVRGGIL